MRKDDPKRTIAETLNPAEMHGYEVQKQLKSRGVKLNISNIYRARAIYKTAYPLFTALLLGNIIYALYRTRGPQAKHGRFCVANHLNARLTM